MFKHIIKKVEQASIEKTEFHDDLYTSLEYVWHGPNPFRKNYDFKTTRIQSNHWLLIGKNATDIFVALSMVLKSSSSFIWVFLSYEMMEIILISLRLNGIFVQWKPSEKVQNVSLFIQTKPKLQKHWCFNSQTGDSTV